MRVSPAAWGIAALFLVHVGPVTAAGTVPAYIQADPALITKAFGDDLAKRIFSDEFTKLRMDKISPTLDGVPGLDCPASPDSALTDIYPSVIPGYPTAWLERYSVDCNRKVRRSVLMILDGQTVSAVAMMPGDTMAGPVLQRDTLGFVRMAAQTGDGTACDQVFVSDTTVVTPPEPAGMPWSERWTVMACGKSIDMDVGYVPTPADGGTDISVHAVKP